MGPRAGRLGALLALLLAACDRSPGGGPTSGPKPPKPAPVFGAEDDSFSAEKAADEKVWIPHRLRQLERIMARATFSDILLTKAGRSVEGKVMDEGGAHFGLETPYGRIQVVRTLIKEMKPGVTIHADFKWRLSNADPVQVWKWALDSGLSVHREYLAYQLLPRDPSNPGVRAAAGYRKTPAGWQVDPKLLVDPAGARRPDTREEVQEMLERLGYLQRDGRWHVGAPWSAVLDTLHNTGPWKYTMEDVQITDYQEAVYPEHVFHDLPHQRSTAPKLLKFFSPLRNVGSVSIQVRAPAEIVSCEFKAMSEIIMDMERKKFGKIEVSITPEGGAPVPVFMTDDQLDRAFHDVTAHVKGKAGFTIHARLTTKIDKYHHYARFLPGMPNAKEVLVVQGLVLKAAPEIDGLWAQVKAP